MAKKNTYENAEITDSGANAHLSGLHNSTIRTNQYVWDMMKILEQEEMFGFHFEAKVGAKKILVILHHEDKEKLKEAQKLLREVQRDKDVVFITKIKTEKKMDKRWFIFYFFILLTILALIGSFVYQKGYLDRWIENSTFQTKPIETITPKKEVVVEEIEVDIEKLKALKESFDEQNSTTLDAKTMKALSITTDIISEVVSEEEKAKYSTEALVKSFKGKSGFKLVVKEDKKSKDFNKTVEELNAYAQHFVKENNLSEALHYYDKVSKEENVSKKEKLVASFHQAEIFEEMGLNEEAKKAYEKSLKVSRSLKEGNRTIGTLNELVNLGKLATLHQSLDEPKLAEEHLKKAEQIYELLVNELKKFGELKESELALALNYLANFYDETDKDLLAIDMRKKALKIYEKLLKKEYKKFALNYYKSINSLGNSYLKIDHSDFAIREYERALHVMKKMVKSKVVKNREFMALSYKILGRMKLYEKKFKESQKYYDKAFNYYQFLAKKEKDYRVQATEMQGEFARLYEAEKKFKLADEAYQKGIDEFTEMNEKTKKRYNLEIAYLLNRYSAMKIRNNIVDTQEMQKVKKALQRAKNLAHGVLKINFKRAKESMAKSYAYLAYLEGMQHNLGIATDFYQMASLFKSIKGVKELRRRVAPNFLVKQ